MATVERDEGRLRTPLVDTALVLALILQIFPDALLATPMFIMFRHFGLLNTFMELCSRPAPSRSHSR